MRLGEALPGLHYVGWNVLVSRDGYAVIEGNNRPDVSVQIHGPLLTDERVRRFMHVHGRRLHGSQGPPSHVSVRGGT